MYTPKFNQVTDRAVLLEAMQAYSFAILIGPQAASHDAGSETIAPHCRHASAARREGRRSAWAYRGAFRHGQSALAISRRPRDACDLPWAAQLCFARILCGRAIRANMELHRRARLRDAYAGRRQRRKGSSPSRAHQNPRARRLRSLALDAATTIARSMLAGIVGFRIPIARIEGKFKISQNRLPEERANVKAAHAAGDR